MLRQLYGDDATDPTFSKISKNSIHHALSSLGSGNSDAINERDIHRFNESFDRGLCPPAVCLFSV
jgi:hypothetical protein